MNRICTIIAMNYLPQAMALLKSTRRVYPDIEFYVLIIDGDDKAIPFLPSAKILLPSDLNIHASWLVEMNSYYDAVELATSLKPFLLDTLLEVGVETVTFLDPDILLFSELTDGIEAAIDYGIALTPHRLTPSNILDQGFNEISFLQYGVFNLGYITVGQKSKAMLNWWGERLRWYCTKFPSDAVFTDQKWMNFVPALFNFKVVKNLGYNLASWNIDERPLSYSAKDETLYAGTNRLTFIHFSQMSGVLAAGGTTDHWEKTLKGSPEFDRCLEIIIKITQEYADSLIQFRRDISQKTLKANSRAKLSYHSKRKVINKSMDSSRGVTSPKVSIFKFTRKSSIQYLLRILEKSATINGFRDGFALDQKKFHRIVQKRLKRI
jgi:hypothetical protein